MASILSKLPRSEQKAMERFLSDGKLRKFAENVSGIEFGMCRWGSCQYSSDVALFDTLERLSRFLPEQQVLSLLGASVNLGRAQSESDALAHIKQRLAEDCVEDLSATEQSLAEIQPQLDSIDALETADDVFIFSRNEAQHLSEPVELVFHAFFPEAEVVLENDSKDLSLLCWLLYRNGIVQDEKSFAHFDT